MYAIACIGNESETLFVRALCMQLDIDRQMTESMLCKYGHANIVQANTTRTASCSYHHTVGRSYMTSS